MDLTTYALLNKKIKKVEEKITSTVKTINITANKLQLTTDKIQTVTMVTGTTILLPSATSFTEIRLMFKCSADLTLTFPSIKWQSTPEAKANKIYEYCFTYVDATIGWLGGWITYS